jgi:hypothetical protein
LQDHAAAFERVTEPEPIRIPAIGRGNRVGHFAPLQAIIHLHEIVRRSMLSVSSRYQTCTCASPRAHSAPMHCTDGMQHDPQTAHVLLPRLKALS